MEIKEVSVESLIPYEWNNKKHDEVQINRIANSIKEFWFKNPILIDKNNVIIAGHGRLESAKKLWLEKVPVIIADDLTEDQIKKYRILDNKLNESERDLDNLKVELESLPDFNFWDLEIDVDDLFPELAEIEEVETPTFKVEEDEIPEVEEAKVVREWDYFKLWNHRLLCGDSTRSEDLDLLMNGEIANMIFTDPPYWMKKENEGVLNDNLNYDDLLEFNEKRIPLSFNHLAENGSRYCRWIDEPLMDIYAFILRPMQAENKITFRNLITRKKENENPTMLFNWACSTNKRSYYTNEKCLFVMSGVEWFNNNQEHYNETYEPIRKYMEDEAKKVWLTSKKLTEITGVQMYGHRFTKSQFGIIPEHHYKKLQEYYKEEWAFGMNYDDLKNLFDKDSKEYAEYKSLREAVLSKRAYFDWTQDQCIDVRVNDVTSQKERQDTGWHATPKPLAICGRWIKASSREWEIVLDLFGWSGSTLIACEQLNRKCYMLELDPKYCEVIIKRFHKQRPDAEIKCLNREIKIEDILEEK